MPVGLEKPDVDRLSEVVRALREWQHDGGPAQLHLGDLGWHWRFGAEVVASAVRTWRRGEQILAIGMLDGPELLRLALAPDAQYDDELAGQLLADLSLPEQGVLPAGDVAVEARTGALLRGLLLDGGWTEGEPWTPLRRELAQPVEPCSMRIEVISPDRADVRVAVQRAAFDNSTFTGERWQAMAAGPAYGEARCLVGYDGRGAPVAAATVWSAGPGRPGLLEPVGVHREHRGHGYGTAITIAAASALRELGSSSATVCTSSSNLAAVATYRSAGFQQLPDVPDLRRAT